MLNYIKLYGIDLNKFEYLEKEPIPFPIECRRKSVVNKIQSKFIPTARCK